MKARLVGKAGQLKGQVFDIEGDTVIGRSSRSDVCLSVGAVSGTHARIFADEGANCFFLEDLGSLNGTELDGSPVQGKERLGRLHVVRFAGEVDLIWQGPELVQGPQEPPPPKASEADSDDGPAVTDVTLVEQMSTLIPKGIMGPGEGAGGAGAAAEVDTVQEASSVDLRDIVEELLTESDTKDGPKRSE